MKKPCQDCRDTGAKKNTFPELEGVTPQTGPDECQAKTADGRFHQVLAELADLHQKKGADYGRGVDPLANLRASSEFGIPPWQGVLLRMNDKMHRLKSLVLNGKLANEPAEDSLLDMAAYSVLALILLREAKEKQKEVKSFRPGSQPIREAS